MCHQPDQSASFGEAIEKGSATFHKLLFLLELLLEILNPPIILLRSDDKQAGHLIQEFRLVRVCTRDVALSRGLVFIGGGLEITFVFVGVAALFHIRVKYFRIVLIGSQAEDISMRVCQGLLFFVFAMDQGVDILGLVCLRVELVLDLHIFLSIIHFVRLVDCLTTFYYMLEVA